jgi:hypothetical protein
MEKEPLVELHLLQPCSPSNTTGHRPEVLQLLSDFAEVFTEPTGLPPRRQYDHPIPLVSGARPVSMQTYRVTPEFKTEIERQVQDLLQQGVISHSNSVFASLVLLVKKGDKNSEPNSAPVWRLVIDYHHLNTLIVKGKYPLHVIDELLDKLSGAQWFSKLDLRAGYHQIRLALRGAKDRIPNAQWPL